MINYSNLCVLITYFRNKEQDNMSRNVPLWMYYRETIEHSLDSQDSIHFHSGVPSCS